MANGKISFTPPASYALTFDESHYLELADNNALDAGTGDFNVSCIFYLDSTCPGPAPKLLIGKGALDMASLAGWTIAVLPTQHRLRVRCNDGNVTSLAPETADDVFVGDRWYWMHCNFDRSGNLTLYLGDFVTGTLTLVLTSAISSRPGTWSNSNALWMGNWGADAGNYFKGYLGYARLDIGRLVSAAWLAEEWARIKWGLTRNGGDFTACWLFNQSLADTQAGYTFSLLPAATAAYVSSPPYSSAPLSYTFARNNLHDRELGYVPHYQVERAKDKTAYAYGGNVKRRLSLPFSLIEEDQLLAFQSAYEGARTLKYYKDADNPQSLGDFYIPGDDPPEATAQKMPDDRYNLSLVLEEA